MMQLKMNLKGSALGLTGVLLALLMLTGCTPKQELSSIKVAIPSPAEFRKNAGTLGQKDVGTASQNSVGALTTVAVPTRLMINVTGPGISTPIVHIWEMNKDSTAASMPEPPSTIELFVPKGSDRLIQVLAILEEMSEGDGGGDSPMTFFYGDTVRTLSQGAEAVEITLANQGTSGNSQGSISGRYFDAAAGTPTDMLDMLYSPGAGRPPMIVETTYMFGGWFQLFALKGVPFSYRLRNRGLSLFDNTSPDTMPISARVGRAIVPAAYRNQYSNGTIAGRVASPQRFVVFGLFGANAPSAGRACFDTTISQMSDLYTSSSTGDTSTVQYDPSGGQAAEVQVAGGTGYTADDQCPGGSGIFGVDHVAIRKRNLNYGDSPIGNRGPFRGIVSGSSQTFLNATLSGSTLQLAWDYLPGVVGNGVDGVGIFTKVFNSSSEVNDRWHDRAPCNQLKDLGYTEHTRVSAGAAATPVESYTLAGISAAAWNESRMQVVVCPYTASRSDYYEFAITGKNYSGGGGGGGSGPSATQIIAKHIGATGVTSAGDPQTIASDICTPIKIMTADASGNQAFRTGTMSPQLTAAVLTAPAEVKLYTDASCSMPSGGSSTQMISMHNQATLIYVKTTSPATNFSINITDSSSGGTALPMHTYYGSRVASSTPTDLRVFAEPPIMAHTCFPVVFMRGRDATGKFVVDGPSFMSGAQYPAVTDLQFYSDDMCGSSLVGSLMMSSMQGALFAYAKYTGTAASINVAAGGSTGLSHPSTTLAVSQPGAPARLRLSMMQSFGAEACQPVRLTSTDLLGNPSPLPIAAAISYLYNGSGAPAANSGFYSDQNCTASIAGPGLAAAESLSATFYFRWAQPEALSLTGTVSGPAGVAFEALNTTVGPTVLGRIVVRPQGVTYTHSAAGTFSGYGPFTLENESFGLTLEARSPLGNILTGFNNTDLSPSGINLRTDFEMDVTLTCSPLSWTTGVANTNCMLIDSGANNFSSKLFPFRTGGGASMLPFYESGTSSVGHIRISKPGDSAAVMTYMLAQDMYYQTGSCHPFLVVRGYNNSGQFQATRTMAPYNATLSAAAGISGWYSDPGCTASTANVATIPSGAAGVIVYANFDGAAPSAVAADSNWSMNFSSNALTLFSSGSPSTHSSFRLSMSREIAAGSCSPLMVVRTDANGQAVAAAGTESITLSTSSISGTFHSTGFCDGGSNIGTTLGFSAGDSAKLIYFKTMNMAAGGTITATNGGNTGSIAPLNSNY